MSLTWPVVRAFILGALLAGLVAALTRVEQPRPRPHEPQRLARSTVVDAVREAAYPSEVQPVRHDQGVAHVGSQPILPEEVAEDCEDREDLEDCDCDAHYDEEGSHDES